MAGLPRMVLVANRGEVVRRVARTARALGIGVAGVYADSDRGAVYLRDVDRAVALGDDSTTTPYLDIAALLDAARRVGADALHPGYGFLAESAELAEACLDAGLLWVGPPPEAIRAMARKVEAKSIARAAGVPVLEGVEVTDDLDAAARAAVELGFPLLVKPSAGGGGKGMHRVDAAEQLQVALETAQREARSAFGDGTLFVERYLATPHHVEVQVLADALGACLHLGERECSVQRRHQKIVEETPAPTLNPQLRERMTTAAVSLARQIGYTGAGTVEFLVTGDEFFFLEMNTRLQVEHAVTEEVTGLDLVAEQLRVACGQPLSVTQDDVAPAGASIEVRLYAEDPARGFLPSPGRVLRYDHPVLPGVRWEDGVESGSDVSPRYDPMIAKVVASAPTRQQASGRLLSALQQLRVHGVRTNRDLLLAVLRSPQFAAGDTTTDLLDRHPELLTAGPGQEVTAFHAAAAALVRAQRRNAHGAVLAAAPTGWRNVRAADATATFRCGDDDVVVGYRPQRDGSWVVTLPGATPATARMRAVDGDRFEVEVDGMLRVCEVHEYAGEAPLITVDSADGNAEFRDVPALETGEHVAGPSATRAPLPGVVVDVAVTAGATVDDGDELVVLEAMKMEHRLRASGLATVDQVHAKVGDSVSAQQVLVTFAEPGAGS